MWLLERTIAVVMVLVVFGSVEAQDCAPYKLTNETQRQWYNPNPSRDDYLLPMPLGMSMVFVPVSLGTQGLYGDEKTTYVMGSSKPRLFETSLEVRVGSSISGRSGARILFGKYEVSKAQYAAVMGNGSLRRGLVALLKRTRDSNAKATLSDYVNRGKCRGVMTRELHKFLSEPLTFLSYRDYIDFLDAYNLFCISRLDCRRKLSELGPNRDVPGFIRLPAEHEWEFVARGGRDFVAGRINKVQLQSDLPPIKSGATIVRYAHVGSDPPRLLPIGSREPFFGVYDLLGNAQELMLNPFTAENGFGAVGAYVARGGHFRLAPNETRVSRRVELQAFRLEESSGNFVIQYFPLTGIRVVVGYPVIGAARRLGDSSLLQDFAENYTPPSEAGDVAGNTIADARDLETIGDNELEVKEELSDDDKIDFYKVSLRNYATLSVTVSSDAALSFEVLDELQAVMSSGQSNDRIGKSSALLPGDYWIKVTPSRRLAKEERYQMKILRKVVTDTGIARPDPAAFRSGVPSIRAGQQALRYSGYVGSGDTVDTYPVVDQTNIGGMEFRIVGADGAVTLTYLDEKLNIVRRSKPSATNEVVMNVNSFNGQKGFVQVSAPITEATTYRLTVTAVAPFDPVFVKSVKKSAAAYATEKQSYKGNLDSSLPALYLPIRVSAPRMLKIELTEMVADVDLKVEDATGRTLTSSHVRKGTASEFFSKAVPAGVYFASVRLKSSNNLSGFKLLYATEEPPAGAFPTDPAVARSKAVSLTLSSSQNTRYDNKKQEDMVYYKFYVRQTEELVDVEVSNFASSADLDLFLEDKNGNVLAKSSNSGGTAEKIKFKVSGPKTYHLRIKRTGTADKWYYKLTYSSIGAMLSRNLSYGSLVERHGAFRVYRDGEKCTLLTEARKVTPEFGWRRYRPYFRITVWSGGGSIWIYVDSISPQKASDVYRSGTVKGKIDGIGRIPLVWDKDADWLKPLNSNGNVSGDALRGFRNGRTLTITGITPQGLSTRVEYSLIGYTKAAQRINQLCGADADWIWNRYK